MREALRRKACLRRRKPSPHIPQVPLRTRRRSPARRVRSSTTPLYRAGRASFAPLVSRRPPSRKKKVAEMYSTACYRYWPVWPRCRWNRPASAPFLPDTRVRMSTIRWPSRPVVRVGGVGRSSFSLIFVPRWSRWEPRRPLEYVLQVVLDHHLGPRSTMFLDHGTGVKGLKVRGLPCHRSRNAFVQEAVLLVSPRTSARPPAGSSR